mmetsp:Transcript_31964/g.85616  ORF Transcript_31964/g.85616 Transcript_31964/m.85616 type:complete len:346 (+) Transcript_31964:1012-2049(+)
MRTTVLSTRGRQAVVTHVPPVALVVHGTLVRLETQPALRNPLLASGHRTCNVLAAFILDPAGLVVEEHDHTTLLGTQSQSRLSIQVRRVAAQLGTEDFLPGLGVCVQERTTICPAHREDCLTASLHVVQICKEGDRSCHLVSWIAVFMCLILLVDAVPSYLECLLELVRDERGARHALQQVSHERNVQLFLLRQKRLVVVAEGVVLPVKVFSVLDDRSRHQLCARCRHQVITLHVCEKIVHDVHARRSGDEPGLVPAGAWSRFHQTLVGESRSNKRCVVLKTRPILGKATCCEKTLGVGEAELLRAHHTGKGKQRCRKHFAYHRSGGSPFERAKLVSVCVSICFV